MIAHDHDIIVSFYIFSLLKYDRIFGKSLEHDTYGVKESPWHSTFSGEFDAGLSLRFMLVFFSYDTFK